VDFPTLFFVEASLLFLLSLTMLASSVGQSGQSANYWFAASNFCGGTGLLLHCLNPNWPLPVSVVLSNLLLFFELTFMNKAMAEFVGRGRRVWLYLLGLSVVMAVAVFRYTLLPEQHSLRIVFISVVAASTAICSATLLFRSLRDGMRISTVAMGILFCLYATTNTVRLFTIWRVPQQNFIHIWFDRTIIDGLAFGFLWMTNARLRASLEHLAGTDALTGTLNRRAIERQTERVFNPSRRRNDSVAVLMLDIDHFKALNDTHGHHAGDVALTTFAKTVFTNVRRADLAARYGGEEFVVLMPNTSTDEAFVVAEKIRAAVAATEVELSERARVRLTVSVGVAAYPEDTDSAAELFGLADEALYEAKRMGRDQTCLASRARPSMVQDARVTNSESSAGARHHRSSE
jgi:diguanylate cyclase (GGDEF)-like protein